MEVVVDKQFASLICGGAGGGSCESSFGLFLSHSCNDAVYVLRGTAHKRCPALSASDEELGEIREDTAAMLRMAPGGVTVGGVYWVRGKGGDGDKWGPAPALCKAVQLACEGQAAAPSELLLLSVDADTRGVAARMLGESSEVTVRTGDVLSSLVEITTSVSIALQVPLHCRGIPVAEQLQGSFASLLAAPSSSTLPECCINDTFVSASVGERKVSSFGTSLELDLLQALPTPKKSSPSTTTALVMGTLSSRTYVYPDACVSSAVMACVSHLKDSFRYKVAIAVENEAALLQTTDASKVAAVTTLPLPKRAYVKNSTVAPLSFAAYLSPSNCMETSLDLLSRLLTLDEISAGYKCAFDEGKHSADAVKSVRSAQLSEPALVPDVSDAGPSQAMPVSEDNSAPLVVVEAKGEGVPALDHKTKSEGGCSMPLLAGVGAGVAIAVAVAVLSLS